MSRTFEELAGPELNNLYRGALFLTAGDEIAAEELLVDTLTGAFVRGTPSSDASSPAWLEGELASTFVAANGAQEVHPPRPIQRRPQSVLAAFDDVGASALLAAAGAVPPRPRAALWLVMLQRWEYADAADALGVDRGELVMLLRHRDTLVAGVLRQRPHDGSGSRVEHWA